MAVHAPPVSMDTLYTLLRSVDNSCSPPLEPGEAAEILAKKKAHFAEEAKNNPLAREILRGGTIACDGFTPRKGAAFLAGPPTFFRTHELLRKTRSADLPLCIGQDEYPHNEVAAMFARCVPNVRLEHAPWWSLSRYTTSLGLSWGSTLLVAHLVARGADNGSTLDTGVLYYMGLYTTFIALIYTTFKHNRDVRRSAPWNTAIYLDLNTDLVRRDLLIAAAARKEFMPRQGLFKTPVFYYTLARKIENHGFDAELDARLADHKSWPPSTETSFR